MAVNVALAYVPGNRSVFSHSPCLVIWMRVTTQASILLSGTWLTPMLRHVVCGGSSARARVWVNSF